MAPCKSSKMKIREAVHAQISGHPLLRFAPEEAVSGMFNGFCPAQLQIDSQVRAR